MASDEKLTVRRYDWNVVDSDGVHTRINNSPEPTWMDDWVAFYDPTTPGEYEENMVALFTTPRSVVRVGVRRNG